MPKRKGACEAGVPFQDERKEGGQVSLLRQGKAEVLTIYLGEADQWHGTSLAVALVQFFREQGCAGATVTRAVMGYGAGSRLHEDEVWRLSSDAPLILQVVDQPERLHRLLPQVQEMVSGGLITLHETTVLKYTHARRTGLPSRLPVRQVMETSLVTVRPETPIAQVIDTMLTASFRALPVVDAQGRLVGMIGTRDLLTAGVLPVRRGIARAAQALDDQTAQTLSASLEQARQRPQVAANVLNPHVRSLRPEQSVREAAQVMLETGLRALPVVESDGRLLGMLTRADLLQVVVTSPLMSSQASSPTQPLRRTGDLPRISVQEQPVATFMHPDVATVEEDTPLAEVIDALISSPYKRVLVVDQQQRVRGILSDVDVLLRVQAGARLRWLDVLTGWARGKPGRVTTGLLQEGTGSVRVARDLMNREVVSVLAETSVQEAIERILHTGRKMLPVLDREGRLLGIVGRSDLLQVLLEER